MNLLSKSFKAWCLVILATTALGSSAAFAEGYNLPNRTTPIPQTTNSVPHIQIGVEPIPQLSSELLRRVSEFVGVDLRGTIVGRSGSTGFWLSEMMKLARPDVIVRGREFAHMHPDGSLHASLDPALAAAAVKAGWATPHPWAKQRSGWEGFVMIYTPGSNEELEVAYYLVKESYRFVTGREIASSNG